MTLPSQDSLICLTLQSNVLIYAGYIGNVDITLYFSHARDKGENCVLESFLPVNSPPSVNLSAEYIISFKE